MPRLRRCDLVRTLALAFASLHAPTPVHAQTPSPAAFAASVDSIVAAALRDGRTAGMSVAVVRGRDTLVLKGYGYADLEFDVPTPQQAVYEIGSVTKQFTAAAILQLQERGLLALDADVTTYLPDYPTQGHRIPLRRLLDHTSGIQGYTEMQEFGVLQTQRLPRDTLVKLFASRPFMFAPGEAMTYNNSAYFLLGRIIEKVSGRSYEEYVRDNLFRPAGMVDSHYCSQTEVIKRRARGYASGPQGLRRASYMDHTWPYSAGSLCSTAGDLVAWNQALHGGKILLPESHRELITPGTLNDGTRLRYAKGVVVDSLFGRPAVVHGGGIPGFVTDLAYFPGDQLTIAVLVNTTGAANPSEVRQAIAQAIYGRWSPATRPFRGKGADYEGEYAGIGRGGQRTVTVAVDSAGHLTLRSGNGPATRLAYHGGETFGTGQTRLIFVREKGRVTRLRLDSVSGYAVLTRAR